MPHAEMTLPGVTKRVDSDAAVTLGQTASRLAGALHLHPDSARLLVTVYAAQLGYDVALPGPADDSYQLTAADATYVLETATDVATRQATRDDAALRHLVAARSELDSARHRLDAVTEAWRTCIGTAVDEGYPMTVVAKAAGCSRSRAHQIATERRSM